jgi:hypothetical protein
VPVTVTLACLTRLVASLAHSSRGISFSLWDKNAALEKAMKHLGLNERDRTRRSENLSLQVLLVGAPTNERESPAPAKTRSARITDCEKIAGKLNVPKRTLKKWWINNRRKLVQIWNKMRPENCSVGRMSIPTNW